MATITIQIRELALPIYHRGNIGALLPTHTSHREPGMLSVSCSPLAWTSIANLNSSDPIIELLRQKGYRAKFVIQEQTDPGLAAILAWAQSQNYLDVDGRDTQLLHGALSVGGLLPLPGLADEAAYIAWALQQLTHSDVDGVWFISPNISGSNSNVTRGGIFWNRLNLFTQTNVSNTLQSDPNTLPSNPTSQQITF